jgi:hypothetical protein
MRVRLVILTIRGFVFSALCAALMAASSSVLAEKVPLACMGEASAGLKWGSGGWSTVTYNTKNFILVLDGG